MSRAAMIMRLDNPVRNYAWGSPSVLPELLGRPVTGEPVAELWLGAHPAAPSVCADGRGLDVVLAEHPDLLGGDVVRRFGQLPFLLKILAVERPLSLQAHPTKAQAKAGFAAENDAGIALDDAVRNFKDANHKPEQVCALTDFEGLCGFRPTADTARFLTALDAALDVPVLTGLTDRLTASGGLRDVVTDLLSRPAGAIERLLADIVPAAARLVAAGGEWSAEAGWMVRLDEHYPGDRGTVIAMLLNLVRLRPGQALFLRAGELHAYLKGTAVELLANSDNVLRGGLTGKHIDVSTLLQILDIAEVETVPTPAEPDRRVGACSVRNYPSPVADFALTRLDLADGDSVDLPAGVPRVLLCTAGAAIVATSDERVELAGGGGVFTGAPAAVTVSGAAATVFVAAPNL